MKQIVIILSNNWLFRLDQALKNSDVDVNKIKSIHATYEKKKNETCIIITTE